MLLLSLNLRTVIERSAKLLIAVALAGCAGASLRPSQISIQSTTDRPPLAKCLAPARRVLTDPRWAPSVTGGLTVGDVRGEPRLTFDTYAVIAWSPDSSLLAISDTQAITVWRASDGELVDITRYPAGPLTPSSVVWSADAKWLAVSGRRDVPHSQTGASIPTTVLLDREHHATREIAALGELQLAGAILRGTQAELDLSTGQRREIERGLVGRGVLVRTRTSGKDTIIELVDRATHATRQIVVERVNPTLRILDDGARLAIGIKDGIDFVELPSGKKIGHLDMPGAEQIEISADGKRAACWTIARGEELDSSPKKPQPDPPAFLAVWNLTTGRELWRDPKHCCEHWAFSTNATFLEPTSGRLGTELVGVDNGVRVQFPGQIREVSPDGQRVIVLGKNGAEIWSTAGVQVLAPARTSDVLARSDRATIERIERQPSSDLGLQAAWTRDPMIALVSGPTCTALVDHGDGDDGNQLAFTPAGDIYGVQSTGNQPTRLTHWRADGAFVRALRIENSQQMLLMPNAARVAIFVEHGVRVLDAEHGTEIAVAAAPRVSYSNTSQLVWDERDLGGDRTSSLGGHLTSTADGRFVAGVTNLGSQVVSIWDLTNPQAVIDLPMRGVIRATAIALDGAHVAGGTDTGTLALWSLPRKQMIALAAQHHGAVVTLAFSPDGRWLATGGDDGLVNVLEVATGALLGSAALAFDHPVLLTWSNDSGTLTIDTARHLTVVVMNHRQ